MSIQTDQVIELTPRSVPAISDHNAESEGISEQASIGAPSPVQQLPPVDGGFHAWAFVSDLNLISVSTHYSLIYLARGCILH